MARWRPLGADTTQGEKHLMYPKTEYIRSKKLLRLVASLRCQHCGNSEGVQAAHANWSEFGKHIAEMM